MYSYINYPEVDALVTYMLTLLLAYLLTCLHGRQNWPLRVGHYQPYQGSGDLHGPPNGPQTGPCEANFREPLVEKGPPGSLHDPNSPLFLDRSQDNRQT